MRPPPRAGTVAFAREYFARRDPVVLEALRRGSVGIAGAGGLGSNVAVFLARAGVGRLVIADFDRVEPSNLNRQHYFLGQVGERKVEALRQNLLAINPYSIYEVHDVRVTRKNAAAIFARVDVLVEAFDRAGAKEMLIETSLAKFPARPVVAASGLAGYGANRRIRSRRLGRLYICGDESSQCPKGISPMAPRVALVAAMQANLVVELLVKMGGRHVQGQ
ncbi:MAG TPA: sulfur carrier protein ThiS adenylyltransferase ThiF [Candidatus Aminicenantes bacterium]|nr:sulfur carrier protein ThiS adenylyltransferase ThiF [Candidatus Aminicenantes bacterium]